MRLAKAFCNIHNDYEPISRRRTAFCVDPDNATDCYAVAVVKRGSVVGLKAMAHIWYEVIQELRYRWENGIALPSLGKSHPDMSCCLLHQKLQ
uniref:Uncharacterized protein n=1 Tax=Amphimedon queenslandica TaxID=400682 RepID=A0A1X7SLK2_AMPQE